MAGLSRVTVNSIPAGLAEVESAPEAPSPEVSGDPSNVACEVNQAGLDELAVQLLRIIPAEGIAIALHDGTSFVCFGSGGNAPKVGTAIVPGVGLCGVCIQQGRLVVEQEIEGDLGSLVAVPIIKGQQPAGCVAAFSAQRHAFREIDIQQLVAIASHLEKFERATFFQEQQDFRPTLSVVEENSEYNDVDEKARLGGLSSEVIESPVLTTSPNPESEVQSVVPEMTGLAYADVQSAAPAAAREPEIEPIKESTNSETAGAPEVEWQKQPQPSPKPGAATKEDLVAELRELLNSSPTETGSAITYNTEEPNKGILRIVLTCIVIALLVVGLARLAGYRRYIPSFISKLNVDNPERSNQKVATTSVSNEPSSARPHGNSKSRRVAPTPAMVVQETAAMRRLVPETEDVEPPPVGLQSSAVVSQIPIVVSTTLPTLSAAESSYKEAHLIHRVNPKYPDLARKMHMVGNVEVEMTVSPQGKVGGVRVISGTGVFASAAIDAVRQWRYVPAQIGGKNVASKVKLMIKFEGHN